MDRFKYMIRRTSLNLDGFQLRLHTLFVMQSEAFIQVTAAVKRAVSADSLCRMMFRYLIPRVTVYHSCFLSV